MRPMNLLTTTPLDDKLREECGVFGVFGHPDAAALTALGLHALQHRGQEAPASSASTAASSSARHLGLVGDNFTRPEVVDPLTGDRAIGHVRYSTHGGPIRNIQPLFAEFSGGGFAIAHNGNLTNAGAAAQAPAARVDLPVHLRHRGHPPPDRQACRKPLVERIIDALAKVEGAYSLVCLSAKKMIGCRDPLGVRPLVLGDLDGAPILASETCALDIIGARFVRDVKPGEMVVIQPRRQIAPLRCRFGPTRESRFCMFEYVYFARPDSSVEGRGVYEVRKRIGAELAREAPALADLVVPVPDSGTPAAIGFAEAAGIPFELGIIRNHYVGRTFIEPTDAIRHMGVRLKHNANRAVLDGKRVVLVDDSIVRGTTSLKIVQMMREAGAAEVHMRIASPPTIHSCFYGVDTPERAKLIASRMTIEEMAAHIKVDSLGFLSIDGLYRAVGEAKRNADAPQFCDACFTGAYPTTPDRSRAPMVPASPRCSPRSAMRCRSMGSRIARRHRRVPRHRPRGRAGAGRGRRARRRRRAHRRRARGARRRDPGERRRGDAGAARPQGLRRHRPARRRDLRALGPRRRAARPTPACSAVTPVAHLEPKVWDDDGDQRHRQLAAHPLARSAAAPRPRRPGPVRQFRRHSGPGPYLGLYAASKAGLEALVATYAAETARTALRVNLINPGPLRTRMRAQAMPGEDPMTLQPPDAVAGISFACCRRSLPRTECSLISRADGRAVAVTAPRSSRDFVSPRRGFRPSGAPAGSARRAGRSLPGAHSSGTAARRQEALPGASRRRRRSAAAPWPGSGSGA